jgi:bacteriorhodopsin
MFGVFWQLAVVGRVSAARLGRDVYRAYMACGVLTLFVWLLYPVAWGLCEGGNVISANYEAIFYGILDFFAKPVFSIALIYGHWSIDPNRLGLRIDDYTDPEKPVPGQHEDGADRNEVA